jgi:acetyl-CoA carboxylase biotin carboxyl carrier protein
MELDRLKRLIEIMEERGLSELEVGEKDFRIRIKKEVSSPSISKEKLERKEETHKDTIEITSPLVGILHLSPSTEAPPYVKIGDEVKRGQIVCCIEAMNIMNEVKSEVEGEVVEILAKDEYPVEYGQPLFLLKPHK